MIDIVKTSMFIESSFLSSLLANPDITDISYNGEFIFYQDTKIGRRKSDINISYSEVKDFLRHIANLAEKQFSFSEPILEVSVGKYRINALHHSLAKKAGNDALSFSIRIASGKIQILDDPSFMPVAVNELLASLIHNKYSIIIAGLTGSGKTELQKYLLYLMEDNTRVIVIDNLLELDYIKYKSELDLNIWQSNEKREASSTQSLVKVALRNNPDWLIVAESRGKEANDVLSSLLTGHPIITTIHAFDARSIPNRFARLVMNDDKRSDYSQILEDIFYHLHFYIYVEKTIKEDGSIDRYIKEIVYTDDKGESTSIYLKDDEKDIYHLLPPSVEINQTLYPNAYKCFIERKEK